MASIKWEPRTGKSRLPTGQDSFGQRFTVTDDTLYDWREGTASKVPSMDFGKQMAEHVLRLEAERRSR